MWFFRHLLISTRTDLKYNNFAFFCIQFRHLKDLLITVIWCKESLNCLDFSFYIVHEFQMSGYIFGTYGWLNGLALFPEWRPMLCPVGLLGWVSYWMGDHLVITIAVRSKSSLSFPVLRVKFRHIDDTFISLNKLKENVPQHYYLLDTLVENLA